MKKKKKFLGFTLIEVLTALTILAIAMLGFVPLVITTIRAQSFGNKMTHASEIAQDKLEEIRRRDFDDPVLDAPMTYTEPTIDGIYDRSYTVTLIGNDIKRISVSVDWRSTGMPQQNTTYITTKVRY